MMNVSSLVATFLSVGVKLNVVLQQILSHQNHPSEDKTSIRKVDLPLPLPPEIIAIECIGARFDHQLARYSKNTLNNLYCKK